VIASVALGSGVITSLTYSLIMVATLLISLTVPVLLGQKAVVERLTRQNEPDLAQ
jgi:hypothetical protein